MINYVNESRPEIVNDESLLYNLSIRGSYDNRKLMEDIGMIFRTTGHLWRFMSYLIKEDLKSIFKK